MCVYIYIYAYVYVYVYVYVYIDFYVYVYLDTMQGKAHVCGHIRGGHGFSDDHDIKRQKGS